MVQNKQEIKFKNSHRMEADWQNMVKRIIWLLQSIYFFEVKDTLKNSLKF